MSGFNNTGSRFVPMTPGPANPGLNPRYVPPAKRMLTFGAMDPIERPESTMSNESFVSQAPDGGVSINSLMYGNHQGVEERETGDSGAGFGDQRGYASDFGQSTAMPAGGQGPMMGGSGHGYQERGFSGTVMGGAGGFNAPGGFGADQRAYGGFGGFGAGPRGNYTFGGNPTMSNNHVPIFLNQNKRVPLPNFGAIGTALPRPAGYGPVPNSPDSANDSVRDGGNTTAYELAQLIRSGACEFTDDDDTLIGFGNRSFGHGRGGPKHNTTPSTAVPVHRATRSTANAELDPKYKSAIVVVRDSNNKGNAAAFIAVEPLPLPEFFIHLARGIKPTVEELFFCLPVLEPCRSAVASNAGVIRVRNIPFTTPRSEITAFVGRQAQIVAQPAGSPYYAVHIIMERPTGKTMDAFIEVSRPSEAHFIVNQFDKRLMNGRHPRLGDRIVEVELSSQEDFMTEMFPRAKNVSWEGATPHILTNNEMYYPGVPSAGFTGFLQNEEIVMVIKHAEMPHRSPFAQRAIIRVYEFHISTLHKYPWFAHECVNMTERRLLFDATMSLAKSLMITIRKSHGQKPDTGMPTNATLQEFTVATLTCPGFSEQQKAVFIQQLVSGGFGTMASSFGMSLKFGGVSDFAKHWPFQVVARDPAAQEKFIAYFAGLMREASMGSYAELSLADKFALRASGGGMEGPFGHISFDYGEAKTLHDVGRVELRTIEAMLSRVLPRSRANSDA